MPFRGLNIVSTTVWQNTQSIILLFLWENPIVTYTMSSWKMQTLPYSPCRAWPRCHWTFFWEGPWHCNYFNHHCWEYALKNPTGVLQVVNFTYFMQPGEEIATNFSISSSCNLLVADLLRVAKTMCRTLVDNNLELVINKLLQAMRTHPDIG